MADPASIPSPSDDVSSSGSMEASLRSLASCCAHHHHHQHQHQPPPPLHEASSGAPQVEEPAGAASAPAHRDARASVESSRTVSTSKAPVGVRLRDPGRITQFVGHKDRTFHLSYHPNGQLLASASEDCSLVLWDASTGAVRQRITQESEVLRVAWSAPIGSGDHAYLASASSTGKVRIWKVMDKGTPTKTPVLDPICELSHGEESQVYACKFLDDTTLLTASDDMVHFWNLETKTQIGHWNFDQLSTEPAFGGSVRNPSNICYVFDVEVLCVALSDGSVRIQDLRTAKAVATLRKTGGAHLTALKLGRSAGALVSCGGNGDCTLWDVRNWSIRATLQGHTRPVYGAEFLPPSLALTVTTPPQAEDSLLMTWSTDETLRLWDLTTAEGIVTAHDAIHHPGFPILTCAISPLADRMALGGGTGDAHHQHQEGSGGCCEGKHAPPPPCTSILVHHL